LISIADGIVRQLHLGSGGGADHPQNERALALCGLDFVQLEEIVSALEEELEEQVDVIAEVE
jgi:hypothetical protein